MKKLLILSLSFLVTVGVATKPLAAAAPAVPVPAVLPGPGAPAVPPAPAGVAVIPPAAVAAPAPVDEQAKSIRKWAPKAAAAGIMLFAEGTSLGSAVKSIVPYNYGSVAALAGAALAHKAVKKCLKNPDNVTTCKNSLTRLWQGCKEYVGTPQGASDFSKWAPAAFTAVASAAFYSCLPSNVSPAPIVCAAVFGAMFAYPALDKCRRVFHAICTPPAAHPAV